MSTPSHSTVPRVAWLLVATRGISSLGSTLTAFGLNVWIYRHTGSFPIFALLTTLAGLPEILFAPIAGIITDRFRKKILLLAADGLSAAMVTVTWIATRWGDLDVAVVAATMIVLGFATELRWSALGPTISELVPKDGLDRVNGLQQSFRGANVMLGPLLGAASLAALGLDGLLALDMVSYLIGIIGVLGLRSSPVPRNASAPDSTSFWQELTYGFRWVFARPGLRRLLLFFMLINVSLSIFVVTNTPYVLSFGTNSDLGWTLALEGAGAFLAGMYLVKRRVALNQSNAVMGAALVIALCMCAWGIFRDIRLLGAVVFVMGASITLIAACSQTIWQQNVPIATQGKVFAVRTVVAFGLTPLATLGSIPLASAVFGPAIAGFEPAQSVWGSGTSAALGGLVSACGLLMALCAGGLWLVGGLRVTENLIPAAATEAS
jgi:MFS transporter, DHA3 family, macrolide efflux protein